MSEVLQLESQEISVPGTQIIESEHRNKRTRVTLPSLDESTAKAMRLPTKPPKRIKMGRLHDPQLRIEKPIPVEVLRKKDGVTAVWRDIGESGHGVTMSDALDDLSRTLAELFFSLSDDAAIGTADLRKVRKTLHRHIGMRPTK